MPKRYIILLFLVFSLTAYSQKQIVITTVKQTDRTFHENEELFLEEKWTLNQIIYTLDTIEKQALTRHYLVKTHYSIWDGDSTIKEDSTRKYVKWKNKISLTQYGDLVKALNTDIDTLKKDQSFLHTSHHYLDIYIEVIEGSDTTRYYKTKPFAYLTPWYIRSRGYILNPAIDAIAAILLPKQFLNREELLLSPVLSEEKEQEY